MIKYSDQTFSSTTLPTLLEKDGRNSSAANENSTSTISLTSVWECIVRTNSLPEGLELTSVFALIQEKLRNPEWEVRQHALRVLTDLIPLISDDVVDENVEAILGDLVTNLGHIAPAVRKGAIDSLRTYLKHSKKSDDFLKNLVEKGVETAHANNIHVNIIVGIILSIPFLILPNISDDTISYIVQCLLMEIVQITRRDITLRSLVRIKELVGSNKFNQYLNICENEEVKRNFDLLCDAHYSILKPNINREIDTFWCDFGKNVSPDDDAKLEEDKIILETEIRLDSGSAIKMQIREESRQNSINEFTDSDEESRNEVGLIRILTDDSEKEEYINSKRTPRRVRFGGEIVKMRTPDSDSNNTSEENNSGVKKSVVKKQFSLRQSLIPVPVKGRNKLNFQKSIRTNKTSSSLKLTSIKLKKHDIFGNKVNGLSSRIPRRKIQTSTESSPSHKIDGIKKSNKTPNLDVKPLHVGEKFSPIPVHREIEVLHNLTRSPSRILPSINNSSEEINNIQNDDIYTSDEDNRLSTADNALLPKKSIVPQRKIQTADNAFCTTSIGSNYNSFKICLPEENSISIDASNEDCGIHPSIAQILNNKENIRERLHALESFLQYLTASSNLESLEEKLPFILNVLFSSTQQALLKNISEKILTHLFENLPKDTLQKRLSQIIIALSKLGEPDGVRLAIVLMRRISPMQFVKQLISDSTIGAKSSKIREGALQILMAISILFPSSDIDVPNTAKCVMEMLRDRKRRVRQAALETLASLGQSSSPSAIMSIARSFFEDTHDGKLQLALIRTRLSKKQLPRVNVNGNILYSSDDSDKERWTMRHNGKKNSENVQKTVSYTKMEEDKHNNNWINDSQRHYFRSNRNFTALDWNKNDETFEEKLSKSTVSEPNLVNTSTWKNRTSSGSSNKEETLPRIDFHNQEPDNFTFETRTRIRRERTRHEINIRIDRGKKDREISLPPTRIASLNNLNNSMSCCGNDSSFTKSFSTENVKFPPTDSASSGCSSVISTGYYTRFGVQQQGLRSGIPVPVRFKVRQNFERGPSGTASNSVYKEENRTPMSFWKLFQCCSKVLKPKKNVEITPIKSPTPVVTITLLPTKVEESKTTTPSGTPIKSVISAHSVLSRQPFSSGSESSGYFTPPAEPQIIEDTSKYQQTEEEEYFVEQPESFITLDSTTKIDETDRVLIVQDSEDRVRAPSTPQSLHEDESEPTNLENNSVKVRSAFSSLDNLDFLENASAFDENKTHSKSEVNLTDEFKIVRKTVSSAPVLNDNGINDTYPDFREELQDFTKITLPGAVIEIADCTSFNERIEPEKTESAKKVPKRRSSKSRSSSKFSRSNDSLFPDSLTPFSKPRDGYNETLAQLESNEWEITMKGLQGLTRLVRHHQQIVESQMHTVCVALGKHIKNLRSQVARAACSVASEMFAACKRSLEIELDELAAPLLHRTADTNKFLRSDANTALDIMCNNLSPPKVVGVVTSKGSVHHNAVVRSTAIRLLCSLTHRLGAERVFQLPRETRDKILLTGANMLTEGSLETRKHAKMLLGLLMQHCQFNKAMTDAVPARTLRHIEKTLISLK